MSKSKKTTTSKTPKTTAKPAAKRSKAKAVASLAGPTPEQAQAATEAIGQAPENAPEAKPEARDATVANVDSNAAPETTTPATPPAPAPETKPARKVKAPKEPKLKKPSGLDAAAQVLKDKGEPMSCKDIMETMLAKGLWTTNGKTPAATLYSAILREIDGKPGESRFVKTGRGLFSLTNQN